jgi:hypothetical protein
MDDFTPQVCRLEALLNKFLAIFVVVVVADWRRGPGSGRGPGQQLAPPNA